MHYSQASVDEYELDRTTTRSYSSSATVPSASTSAAYAAFSTSRQRPSPTPSSLHNSNQITYSPSTASHTPPSRNSTIKPDEDADQVKKSQISLTEQRQRKFIIGGLILTLALYCLNHDWTRDSKSTSKRFPPWPMFQMIPNSPSPHSSPNTIPILAKPGLQTYHLLHQPNSHPVRNQDFSLYLPSILADTPRHYSTIGPDHDLFHAFPLVISLHGRGSNGTSECESWKSFAEANRWMIVCPTLLTSAKADDESLRESVTFLTDILDSVMGDLNEASSRLPSLSLTRLIDRDFILLTSHSGGGYTALDFALQRPNYWTALAFRSTNFWSDHYEQVLRLESSKFDWYMYTLLRPILYQYGEFDHERIKSQMVELSLSIGHDFHLTSSTKIIPNEKHESRVDITAQWWREKIKVAIQR